MGEDVAIVLLELRVLEAVEFFPLAPCHPPHRQICCSGGFPALKYAIHQQFPLN